MHLVHILYLAVLIASGIELNENNNVMRSYSSIYSNLNIIHWRWWWWWCRATITRNMKLHCPLVSLFDRCTGSLYQICHSFLVTVAAIIDNIIIIICLWATKSDILTFSPVTAHFSRHITFHCFHSSIISRRIMWFAWFVSDSTLCFDKQVIILLLLLLLLLLSLLLYKS